MSLWPAYRGNRGSRGSSYNLESVSRKKCRAKIAICILFFCYCLGEDFHLAVGKSGQACKAREKYKGEETPLAQIPGA